MHQMIKDFSGLYTYGLKGLYETDISTLPTLKGMVDLYLFLSTRADRQGVDISVTVCVCVS